MQYKAILFDMDGTLLPMDMNTFAKGYFRFLYAKLAKYGLDPKAFQDGMWAGVKAMAKNDGSATNEERFWQTFSPIVGLSKDTLNGDCLEFYGKDFHQAKPFTGENPLAVEAVRLAREQADLVILATNPLFPMVGQETRLSWVGLKPSDFDLVTSYEHTNHCKPNPEYYRDILRQFDLNPADCLMVGNDELEDMYAGTQAGLNGFLVTDCLIPSPDHPWNGPKGTFRELVELLRKEGSEK